MHKIIISTLIFSSFLFSETSYSFLGAQTSVVNYDNISAPSIGLKYGIQKGMWRSSFNLEYSKQSSNTLSSFIFQADKGVLQQTMKNSPFKPHVGFAFGLLQADNDRGIAIGINTGATYLLNDAIDLDLSYRYLSISKLTGINSINSLNFSLHYFY